MYQLKLTSAAQRQMDKLQTRDLERIGETIRKLSYDPRQPGTLKLKGQGQIYRIRIGDWRVIYKIVDKDSFVFVGKVVRRSKDTYAGLDELF